MSRESRKMEHVTHALQQDYQNRNYFDDITLLHNPIPGIDYDQTDLSSRIGELELSSPLLINGMTGGARDTKGINRSLSIAAAKLEIPMAVGSQMAAIKNPDLKDTYRIVREVNPNGIIFANLGSEATVEQAKRAIDMIEANGMQIHLNVMQELIMPEGDRSFSGMLNRIEKIVTNLQVPVIVKEVGFGMPRDAIRRLKDAGVSMIDVGGTGGTNFAYIENKRGGNPYPFLNEWGIPTPISLLEASTIPGATIIASGGLRNGLDIAKSIALGASMVGMAGRFLHKLMHDGVEALIDYIQDLHHQIRIIMTVTGAKNLSDLRMVPLIVRGESHHWCSVRGIPVEHFAQRKLFS